MHIDPVRDEIMYWLTPKDLVELVIAAGILFSDQNMVEYTSMFKYITTDRCWFMNKIKGGYMFTIMGTDLYTLVDYSVDSNGSYDVLRNRSITIPRFKTV
ncbi:hypothetical protein LTR53_020073, partial [Teratosphaeriaceae sp. CCFEE 6253]